MPKPSSESKILNLELGVSHRHAYKTQGKKVVFTNGCFDILHVGHTTYLEQAKALGDILIVGINSDTSVKKLKGPTRPINSQDDRARVLAALQAIDHVIIFEEDTPIQVLAQLQPDIHVKGGDYIAEKLPEFQTISAYGGSVVILPFVPGKSTTTIIQNIQK